MHLAVLPHDHNSTLLTADEVGFVGSRTAAAAKQVGQGARVES